jgi:hypothetical protein
MRSLLLALALTVVASSAFSAADPLDAFHYRASRVPPVGTVVNYVKSNLDGSKPSLVSLYFADADDIEVSKSETGAAASTDVKAHLDWKRFIADRLDSGDLTSDGVRAPRARLTIGKDEVRASYDTLEQRLTSTIHPLHMYNFDLMGLNVMLPQLRNPKQSFTIGFLEPTFAMTTDVIELRGKATATYVGEETVGGRAAHRFHLSGAGLANAEASLWIDADDGLIDLVESPLPNNPEWTSYRLARRGPNQHMSPAEWTAFKLAHIGVGAGSMQ